MKAYCSVEHIQYRSIGLLCPLFNDHEIYTRTVYDPTTTQYNGFQSYTVVSIFNVTIYVISLGLIQESEDDDEAD